jgi:hypothetical protein
MKLTRDERDEIVLALNLYHKMLDVLVKNKKTEFIEEIKLKQKVLYDLIIRFTKPYEGVKE